MAKQADKQSLLLANDQATSHVIHLSDTFLAMYMITVLQMTILVM